MYLLVIVVVIRLNVNKGHHVLISQEYHDENNEYQESVPRSMIIKTKKYNQYILLMKNQ